MGVIMRTRTALSVLLVLVAAAAWAADRLVVEDWKSYPAGTKGIPPGWEGQRWGSPAYDMTVEDTDGRRVLHLVSANEGSTITKDIKGTVNLKETPVLEWSWKVVTLPARADSRKKDTDDQAAQVYVGWPRFPEAVRSRIIGYVWDTTAPVGTIVKSQKTATITYVVVRSGKDDVGKWLTERRNVAEDFRKIYGEPPDSPGGLSVGIDSNDTASRAESYIGPLVFRKPSPG
jgi:hypothetical protein